MVFCTRSKTLAEFTPDEQASWARELEEDDEWRIRADRRRLQDDIIATAARLIAAEAGDQDDMTTSLVHVRGAW